MRKGFLIYEEMRKYLRRRLVIYDFATNPFWISLYMRKYYFRFISVRLSRSYSLSAASYSTSKHLFAKALHLWMRSSRVVRASDCLCQSRNDAGFDPSILRHSEIWGAEDEAVFYKVVWKKLLQYCWTAQERQERCTNYVQYTGTCLAHCRFLANKILTWQGNLCFSNQHNMAWKYGWRDGGGATAFMREGGSGLWGGG
jgi:hypothetical protein